jgi:DNA-binding beta-propeller fold protein YncE
VRHAAGITAAVALIVACSNNDPGPVTATGTAPPSTTPTTEAAVTAGTSAASESTTTTEAPPSTTSTTVATTAAPTWPPTTPATPVPAPPVTARGPAPNGPTGARRTVLSANAPAPRFDVNIYGGIGNANRNPATAGALERVYVPHEVSGTTSVIDPHTFQVIDTFTTGPESQHVVPSWDMTTLYAVSGQGARVTPIDPTTGKPGAAIPVDNPYNLYFTPDGSQAIVVNEGHQRLDFRDPHTFALLDTVQTNCYGLNHLDYSADLSYFIATCEFDGSLIKFDLAQHRVVGRFTIDMTPSGRIPRQGHAQPQDVRLSSDGTVFFVADLQSAGLYAIDGASFAQVGFIPAGVGTHSLYPSRDGKRMYVINRGTNIVGGPPRGQGSVSVLNPYTRQIETDWPVPGGGSPDMGNVTADGTQLWLGGRYDREVYVFDLVNGGFLRRIPVGVNPHGLTVWPQPGRFSLGHTGNQR